MKVIVDGQYGWESCFIDMQNMNLEMFVWISEVLLGDN